MLNILLLSIFQSVFVTNTIWKWKAYLRRERRSVATHWTVTCRNWRWGVWRNIELSARKCDSKMLPQYQQQRKKGLLLPKEVYIHFFTYLWSCIYSRETDRIFTREKGSTKIVPRKEKVDDIISFFCNAFKGEGECKLFPRIRRHYTGISVKRMQK